MITADGVTVVHTPDQVAEPESDTAGEASADRSTTTPVLLFLPGLSRVDRNSSGRLADVLRENLSRGAGTYVVRGLDSSSDALTDGRQIVDAQGTPVLDVYTVSYRDRLPDPMTQVTSTGRLALTKLAVSQVVYLLRAVNLLVRARRKAKSKMAKWQLVVGFGAVLSVFALVAITIVTAMSAFGWLSLPAVSDTGAEALALGATAVTVWVISRSSPFIRAAAGLVEQLIDYAERERNATTVANRLGEGIDAVIEGQPDRKVVVLGYSMGALVAVDFLFPKRSVLAATDDRHAEALAGLVTVGLPLDFVRLYKPDYVKDRTARFPGLAWTNIFIPADVLGSNLRDGNDRGATAGSAVDVAGMRPTVNLAYTSERLTPLNVLAQRGFRSHAEYWGQAGEGNCLETSLRSIVGSPQG